MRTRDQGSGEQIQALVESLAVLEPLGDGREKEKKGDMSLGKSIVLGMDKFSCEIGQDPSAHAAEVVQVVNTLNLSDTDKKTAFLATLQGYPLRTMSGVAGDPLVICRACRRVPAAVWPRGSGCG